MIFNDKNILPLSEIDKHGNSKALEFNSKEEANNYINNGLLTKYPDVNYFAMSENERSTRRLEMTNSEEFQSKSNNIDVTLKELEPILKPIYDYYDNNINGFKLPIVVNSNKEYKKVLKNKLEEYKNELSKIAFQTEEFLFEEISKNCDVIIEILEDLISGRTDIGDSKMKNLLKTYINNEFIVSRLNDSYAFRGVAAFEFLHSNWKNNDFYNKRLTTELNFYRARVVEKGQKIGLKEIISLSYSKRNLAKNSRFSVKNQICLYLGVTSYICAKEYHWDKKEENKELYVSSFKFNSKGKDLKILNLVISEALINGVYQKNLFDESKRNLQNALLKIFPLILATSFAVNKEGDESLKYEYLISQSIVRCMNVLGIDGVAYLSRQGKDDFQYPHGVNIAIPMNDIGENKEYSDLYKCFCFTEPVSLNEKNIKNKGKTKSYINTLYTEYDSERPIFLSKIFYNGKYVFYGKTNFSKLDDYLITQNFYELKVV